MSKKSTSARKLEKAQTRITMLEDRFLMILGDRGSERRTRVYLEGKLSQAVGLLRSAADQFAAREVAPTAVHLRAEADRLDPSRRGDAAGWTGREMDSDEQLAQSIRDERAKHAEAQEANRDALVNDAVEVLQTARSRARKPARKSKRK